MHCRSSVFKRFLTRSPGPSCPKSPTHHPRWLWRVGVLGLLGSTAIGCSDLPGASLPSVTELPNDRDTLIVTADINNQGPNPSRLAFYTANLQTGEVARWLLQNDMAIDQPDKIQAPIEYGPPTWFDDGSGMVYQGLLTGKSGPFLIRPDGTVQDLELPAQVPRDSGRKAWSPDGQWLAYERVRSQGEATFSDIYLLDRRTGSQRLWLANDQSDREIRWLSWSPDSQRLAVARYRLESDRVELSILNLRGDRTIPIREGESIPFRNPDTAFYDFRWLPDGKGLSFLGDRTGAPVNTDREDALDEFLSFRWLFPKRLDGQPRSAIWILDLQTRQLRELKIQFPEPPQGDLTSYTWSPDGQRLALTAGFTGRCRRLITSSTLTCSDRIYLMRANGTELRPLTQVEQWPSYRLIWFSPRSKTTTDRRHTAALPAPAAQGNRSQSSR